VKRLQAKPHPLAFLTTQQAQAEQVNKPGAPPAEVIRDSCRLEYWYYGRRMGSTLSCHRAILIRSADALALAEMTVPWSPNLVHLSARTHGPQGGIVHLSPEDVRVMSTLRAGGSGGSTTRQLLFAMPGVAPGSIVEYRTRRDFNTWIPTHTHVAPSSLPVHVARFQVIAPRGLSLRVDANGFGVSGSDLDQRWTATNLKPAMSEPLLPASNRRTPQVRVALGTVGPPLGYSLRDVFGSWQEVVTPVAKAIWAAAQKGPALAGTSVSAIWSEVQRRVHDRGALTESKAPYRTAAEILRSAHGNADDRAIAMLALLLRAKKRVGFVLLPPTGAPDIRERRPRPMWGADILLHLPDDNMLLDPACIGCSPGELAPQHRGRGGVKLRLRGASFKARYFRTTGDVQRVRAWPREIRHEVALTPRGLIVRKGTWVVRGDAARGLRSFFADHPLPPAEAQREVKKRFLDEAAEGTLSIEGLKGAPRSPLTVHLRDLLLASAATTRADPWVRIPLRGLRRISWIDAFESPRMTPVALNASMSMVHTVRLVLPKGHRAVILPNASFKSTYASYSVKTTAGAGYVDIVERLQVETQTVFGRWLRDFDTFVQDVQRTRRGALVLRRTEGVVVPPVGK